MPHDANTDTTAQDTSSELREVDEDKTVTGTSRGTGFTEYGFVGSRKDALRLGAFQALREHADLVDKRAVVSNERIVL